MDMTNGSVSKKITKEDIIEELKRIVDPELYIDIWTLGLIYEINIQNEKFVHVVMTFTSPMCPAADMLRHQVENALRRLGFSQIELDVTFDPPWKPSEELRAMLGV